MIEESPLEKMMAEERRRQDLLRDLINPPWKKALEDCMTAEDKLRELASPWQSRLDALDALGKSVAERVETMTSAFQGGIDRLLELSAPAQASISNIVTVAQEIERKASEILDSLRGATERTALWADSTMDKLRSIDEKLRTPLQLSVSPAMEDTVASLSKLFEIGRNIAGDAERRYGALPANEIGMYRDLWENQVRSPAFVDASVGFMNDFIGNIEDDQPEEALAVARETVEYLKEHGKEFHLSSAKKGAQIGMTICSFLLLIDHFQKAVESGKVDPHSGSIMITFFFFSLIYAICDVMQKD